MDSVKYKGTLGLWEVMVKKKPESCEHDDLDDNAEILKSSGDMYKGNSIFSRTPKANKNSKWKGIVSHIYQKY